MRRRDADAGRRAIRIGQLEEHRGVLKLPAGERHAAAIGDLDELRLTGGLKPPGDPAAAAARPWDAIEDELQRL